MSEFSDDQLDAMVKAAKAQQDAAEPEWTQERVFARLDEIIIGNTVYKQKLAMVLASYISPDSVRTHSLVVGPSGTGKTYLLQEALPLFKIPFVVIAAGGMVASGFSGMNLKDNIRDFYKNNPDAVKRAIIVIDEFDKISTHAGKSDQFSADIQSELLTLVQGEKDVEIDTSNALWVFLGAFAYTDEMKSKTPKISKSDLTKYGFKVELLGRINTMVMTDMPNLREMLARLNVDKTVSAFKADMKRSGYEVAWQPDAFLAFANVVQASPFGMRFVGAVTAELRSMIGFGGFPKGPIEITPDFLQKAVVAAT